MRSYDYSQQSDDYKRIEKAIQYLELNFKPQPKLEEIVESVHLSKYHFNRMFKRWAGISPIQFQQFMTLDYTKQKLADSRSLLDTALGAGLSGPGRLHDLFVTFEAMTPGEYKKKGAGMESSFEYPGRIYSKLPGCCLKNRKSKCLSSGCKRYCHQSHCLSHSLPQSDC